MVRPGSATGCGPPQGGRSSWVGGAEAKGLNAGGRLPTSPPRPGNGPSKEGTLGSAAQYPQQGGLALL